jgi:hypothetical protein
MTKRRPLWYQNLIQQDIYVIRIAIKVFGRWENIGETLLLLILRFKLQWKLPHVTGLLQFPRYQSVILEYGFNCDIRGFIATGFSQIPTRF